MLEALLALVALEVVVVEQMLRSLLSAHPDLLIQAAVVAEVVLLAMAETAALAS
jgi:hypothetical protein